MIFFVLDLLNLLNLYLYLYFKFIYEKFNIKEAAHQSKYSGSF